MSGLNLCHFLVDGRLTMSTRCSWCECASLSERVLTSRWVASLIVGKFVEFLMTCY